MDPPICVIDARTFVDKIHEIKRWIYRGYLTVNISTQTSEEVLRLSEKPVEQKQPTQEQTRPKSSGRTNRKEQPAFDINPKIAQEYLARVKAGKEERQVFKDRPTYAQEEVQDSLQFQKPSEEYKPWKDIPVVEEKTSETPDDNKPASWAEAARKKLNLANGAGGKEQGPKGASSKSPTGVGYLDSNAHLQIKGPAKPKLVSKSSGPENSPWKVQRNAPKISPTEISGATRPLMSYALWRIHESIHRNDSNQLFVLTENQEVRKFAMRLNLNVLSMDELRRNILSKQDKADLNVFGDLEREGLAKQKNSTSSLADAKDLQSYPKQPSGSNGTASELLKTPEPTAMPPLANADDTADEKEILAGKESSAIEAGEEMVRTKDSSIASQSEVMHMTEPQTITSNSKPAAAPIDPKDLVQSLLHPLQPKDSHAMSREITPELASTVSTIERSVSSSTASLPPKRENEEVAPVEESTRNSQLAVTESQEDIEDSDEEVVVFVPNPKRMSAQKKTNSRPTTAQGPPAAIEQNDSLRQQSPANLSKAPKVERRTAARTPKHGQTKDSGHPRPNSSGPTIIDPNAFGRDFAVNPDSSPRDDSRRPRSRHSPHQSLHQGRSSSGLNGNAADFHPHTSPQRQGQGRSPRLGKAKQIAPATDETLDNPIGSSSNVPVVSHQAFTRSPLVVSGSQALSPSPSIVEKDDLKSKQSRFGPIAPPSKEQLQQHQNRRQSPALQVQTSADSSKMSDVNRNSSAPNLQLPNSAQDPTQHRRPHSNNRNNRSSPNRQPKPQPHARTLASQGTKESKSPHQNQKQYTARPSLFEPDLDSTSASTAATIPILGNGNSSGGARSGRGAKDAADSKMGDVQYVLKSGVPREASRGKGKLWVG